MTSASHRLKVVPVAVPWRISPADSIIGFSGEEGSVVIRVAAFFGFHAARGEQGELEAKAGGRELTDDEMNRLGFHEVILTFLSAAAFRMNPSHSPSELIDEDSFDWSAFPLRYLWKTSFREFREQSERQWETSGISPDPRFYEIVESPVILQFGLTPSRHRHWLVLGHDAYFEIVGSEFEWVIRPGS